MTTPTPTTTPTEATTTGPRFARLAGDALACAWCGIALAEGADAFTAVMIHPAGLAPLPSVREPMGLCPDCLPWADLGDALASRAELSRFGPAGAQRLARAIAATCCALDTDPPHVDAPAAELASWARSFAEVPAPTWAAWVAGRGAVSTACTCRWAHLDDDRRTQLRTALARVLAERTAVTRPPVQIPPPPVAPEPGTATLDGACLICGAAHLEAPAAEVLGAGGPDAVARDLWTRHRFTHRAGRYAGYLCPACERGWVDAGRAWGPTAPDVALVRFLGMAIAPVQTGAVRIHARPAYLDALAHRPTGPAPWAHVGDLDEIRADLLAAGLGEDTPPRTDGTSTPSTTTTTYLDTHEEI